MSIRDVAQRAGVSVGTASNALAGKGNVAADTRARVLAAAQEIGYAPRPRRARSVRDPNPMIGFIVRALNDPLPTNTFYAGILHGAQSVCARSGLGLIHEFAPTTPDRPLLPLMVTRGQVAGLLVVGWMPDEMLELLGSSGVPMVQVDYYVEPAIADVVAGDDARGGYLATKHLLDLAHLDPPPACIMGQQRHRSLRDRLCGYRRALAEGAGATSRLDDDYVRTPEAGKDLDVEHGFGAMRELLELPRPPTAVFCVNDAIAAGALRALHERGVSVPDEVSLVGYDDSPLAAHTSPPLTTVRVQQGLLGAQATRHLLERIEFPDMALRHTRILATLVERSSTAGHRVSARLSTDCGTAHG